MDNSKQRWTLKTSLSSRTSREAGKPTFFTQPPHTQTPRLGSASQPQTAGSLVPFSGHPRPQSLPHSPCIHRLNSSQ